MAALADLGGMDLGLDLGLDLRLEPAPSLGLGVDLDLDLDLDPALGLGLGLGAGAGAAAWTTSSSKPTSPFSGIRVPPPTAPDGHAQGQDRGPRPGLGPGRLDTAPAPAPPAGGVFTFPPSPPSDAGAAGLMAGMELPVL